MSELLEKAREYETEEEKTISKEEKPGFHLAARVGWMNDPNGFSFYDGSYHLFYQYYPYASKWGPMHWGHAVTEDFIQWKYLPVSMAPDESYDGAGCFSGSAIELPDHRHLLMYTGVENRTLPDGGEAGFQTQCLAVGDGINYVKCEDNPVLGSHMIPEGASQIDFRDPKIFQGEDGFYYAVVGNIPEDGSGQILLYESKDAFYWSFKSVLLENRYRYGKMWECPDLFRLDSKWVLLTSPTDMEPVDYEYIKGNGTLGLIGELDKEKAHFIEEANQSIDYGLDFYAPQTLLTKDGRRIMVAWMQNWHTITIRGEKAKWFGQMTLPRELRIHENRLYQWPVRELLTYRKNEVNIKKHLVAGSYSSERIRGRMVDFELTFQAEPGQTLSSFELQLAKKNNVYTSLSFIAGQGILTLDRSRSESGEALLHKRSCKVSCDERELSLRIVMDRYSVEVFVNGGEQALTTTIYTDLEADDFSVILEGATNLDITKYDLDFD